MNPSLTMKAGVCGLEFGNYLGVEKMIDDWLIVKTKVQGWALIY